MPADDELFLLGLEEHFATLEPQRLNGIRLPKGTPRFDVNDVGADWFRAVDLPRAAKEKTAHKNVERLLKVGPF